MANQPAQLPNIDLPGAEFFALAPNSTIALQGRRFRTQSQLNSVPAGGLANITAVLPIEQTFTATSGIFIHKTDLLLQMQDAAQELQITGLMMTVAFPGVPGAGIPLGLPLLTNATVGGAYVGLHDAEILLTGTDISLSTGNPPGGALFWTFQVVAKNNDPTNPHSVNVIAQIIYTRLDGITV